MNMNHSESNGSQITNHGSRYRAALIGSSGMLAQAVKKAAPSQYELVLLDLPEFDITDRAAVLKEMRSVRPQIILNCAAYTNVDGCETEEDLATRVNGDGPGYLAEAAKEIGATLVHISTDYVFDGSKSEPYTEDDATNPKSAYGRSKLKGEQAILESGLEKFFIIRTSWLYGPGGKNFVETILRLAREREELRIVADQVGTPTYTEDLAQGIFDLLALDTDHRSPITDHESRTPDHRSRITDHESTTDHRSRITDHGPYGLYHFSNEGQCSWHEFATAIVEEAQAAGEQVMAKRILPIRTEDYPLPAPRPAYSVFSKEKYRKATGATVPEWRDGLKKYLRAVIGNQ